MRGIARATQRADAIRFSSSRLAARDVERASRTPRAHTFFARASRRRDARFFADFCGFQRCQESPPRALAVVRATVRRARRARLERSARDPREGAARGGFSTRSRLVSGAEIAS
jgi:hypothetical protein